MNPVWFLQIFFVFHNNLINHTTTYTAHRNTTPRTSARTMLEAVRKQNRELFNENEMLRAENAKLLKENEELEELRGEVNKWKTNYSALL